MHNIYICWELRASFENSISLLHVQYENIVIGEHDHFEFHIRNIVQNAFYEMKRVGERIGSSTDPLLTDSDVCYNARRNLVDDSGWITGCKGTGRLPETTAFAIIASPFPKDEWLFHSRKFREKRF